MNNKVIYVDTNFVIGKQLKPAAEIIKEFRMQGFDVFVTKTVIEEVKAYNKRNLTNKINELKGIAKHKLSTIYFPLDNVISSIDIDKILTESDRRCDNYFNKIFKNSIIDDLASKDLLSTLLERDKKKIPPFVEGDSDKGWKDTIIWMAIIQHALENQYDQFYFITEDQFDKNGPKMIDEFKDRTGKKIVFVPHKNIDAMYDTLGIEKKENKSAKDDSPFLQVEVSAMTKEEIDNVKEVINDFMTTEVEYNAFGDTARFNVFEFYEKIDENKIEKLLEKLREEASMYAFFDSINLDEFFERTGINAKTIYPLPIESVTKLVECWSSILSKHPNYKKQFLVRMKQDFDTFLKTDYISDHDDELPF